MGFRSWRCLKVCTRLSAPSILLSLLPGGKVTETGPLGRYRMWGSVAAEWLGVGWAFSVAKNCSISPSSPGHHMRLKMRSNNSSNPPFGLA